jgi:hypothetical protein
MNNKQTIWLCVATFLIGDMEAVIRANRKYRAQTKQFNERIIDLEEIVKPKSKLRAEIKQLKKRIEILKLKNELADWIINESRNFDLDEKRRIYEEKAAFIRIVSNQE